MLFIGNAYWRLRSRSRHERSLFPFICTSYHLAHRVFPNLLFSHNIGVAFLSCNAQCCVFSPPVAVRALIEAAKPGVSVLSLCEKGDAFITAETSKVFKKEKEIKKGNGADLLHMLNCLFASFISIWRFWSAIFLCVQQVSPSPPAFPSTTVCAISLLWKVTLTTHCRMVTWLKCNSCFKWVNNKKTV